MRILYVEDEKFLAEAVIHLLKKEKIAVDHAADGEEGLELALKPNYDAIVLDIMLPKLSGLEILKIIRERGVKTPLYLHSDASQALNLLDINVSRLGVDLLTLNSAKIYGPKGVGALYIAHGVKIAPIVAGGGQENGLRSGTENVPGVIGFAKAVGLAKEHLNGNRKKYASWRKILLSELKEYELINKKHCLDNFVVVSFPGLDAERLIFLLEEKGVYVATGAACAASKGEKSHVLRAIGLSEELINGSLRVTFGETNDEGQIIKATRIINKIAKNERLRIGMN